MADAETVADETMADEIVAEAEDVSSIELRRDSTLSVRLLTSVRASQGRRCFSLLSVSRSDETDR